MKIIQEADLVQSIEDALQYISMYHPLDYIRPLAKALEVEENDAARDAIQQILTNSRMCAEGHRPICQDTGVVNIFIRMGMQVHIDSERSLQEICDEGVRRAYTNADNPLRASMVAEPLFKRKNTGDNTPAMVHVELVAGKEIHISVAAKGGGSENKSRFAMLNPSDSIINWVLAEVPKMGAGWCPPGMLGIGVGGTAEKAMLMAKQSLMAPIDMSELIERGAQDDIETLRIELYRRVNALGIGAQGLGGLTTVLDVKIKTCGSHAASKAVAIIPNCAATRHIEFSLDGTGAARLDPPSLDDWPDVQWKPNYKASRRVNLDTLSRDEVASWQAGERLLLSGKLLTGRDAAHKRMCDMLEKGEKLPVDFSGRVIYYVGPVDPVGDEVVGPAGPTTASRMDKFTPAMLDKTGLVAMIGKADRSDDAIATIKQHQAAYLVAVGGSAYLVSRAIRAARVVAFADLGMEAIREFEVKDMPVTVAIDADGKSIHKQGPAAMRKRILAEKLFGHVEP